MKLGLRVFLGYFFALGLTAWASLTWIERELRPLVRQASEEALVETANALAASVSPFMDENGSIHPALVSSLQALPNSTVHAKIWGIAKERLNLRIYITNDKGIVKFDSLGADIGKDFSRWNDVYLTLKGEYGARSTRADASQESSAVMHVAAPIKKDGQLVGVLTVALPSHSTQAYLLLAKEHLQFYGVAILLASLSIGAIFTWWLIRSLKRIGDYAEHSRDRRSEFPRFAKGTELEKLTAAIDHMRDELEGRHYLENYVHHLTHELKSPLSAIRASNELLGDSTMPEADREKFVANVSKQCERLQILTDSLLQLIRLEQKRQLDRIETVNLVLILNQEVLALHPLAENRNLTISTSTPDELSVSGDPFLLALAIRNLLHNAMQFATSGSTITATLRQAEGVITLGITNQGTAIPEFALHRLGERFYSLPHPDGSKGTGLGLAFVREIMALHHGAFRIGNVDNGVEASLVIPG
jgi:two-component system sensor histidine kinase CreC